MASIKVDTNIQEDLGGSTFTKTGAGHDFVDTTLPSAIETGVGAAKEVFIDVKKDQAATASKSLLEELTGNDRLLDIAQREQAVFGEEEDLVRAQATVGDLANPKTQAHFNELTEMKKKLGMEREAVVQGLLTNDEYRIRAEASFYQQVALTPGIKTELAKVMAEHLGIDPRGQTAAVTMAARDDLAAQTNAAEGKMTTAMIDAGAWKDELSFQENTLLSWDSVSLQLKSSNDIKLFTESTNAGLLQTKAQQEAAAKSFRASVHDASPRAMKLMSQVGGRDLLTFSTDDIKNWSPEDVGMWQNAIVNNANVTRKFLTDGEARTNGAYKSAADLASIDAHESLLLRVLSGASTDEAREADLKQATTVNELMLAAQVNKLQMEYPDLLRIAGFNKIGIKTNGILEVDAVVASYLFKGWMGDVQNLANMTPEQKTNMVKAMESGAASAAASWKDNAKNFTPQMIGDAGDVARQIANQDVDSIGNTKPSQQLFNLIGLPDFFNKVAQVSPKTAIEIQKGVIKHQKATGANYAENTEEVLSELDQNDNVSGLDFHVGKSGEQWIILPNENLDEKLVPVAVGGHLSTTPVEEQDERTLRFIDKQRQDLQTAMNRNPQLIHNMVASRAAVTGLPQEQAAQLVARDLGISITDKKPVKKTAPGGFAEETGAKGSSSSLLNQMKELAASTGASLPEIKEFLESQEKK